ncbi:MAG: hypothetical protein MR270_07955, partial [Erysipelotrichaceae bacterium]|nr:hypothetical protein [Erysipelotrichaceae bacterium]
SCGYFNQDGDFESKENVILEANKTLNMKENEIYRVRISFIDSLPSANELAQKQYKSIVDSIRG